MPIYKGRTPGTWRVTVYKLKQHEWIVDGSRADAQAFEARKRVELEANDSLTTRTAPAFENFCADVYKPHAKAHLAASTWGKVRRYQIETLCLHFGKLKLTDISLASIEAYKTKRARDVKPSSVNNELRILRTVLNWAKSMGYPCAIAAFKKLPIRGAPRVHVWSPDQIGALYDAAAAVAPELVPMLVFLANTGCRKGEAIACEWSWIDTSKAMVRIPSNDAWRPKNGMPREVPISGALGRALERQRARGPCTWTFPNRSGDRYAEFPKDLFAKVREKAGLVGGPHTLRHSFASAFLAARPDMFLLAQVLGHSHTRMTAIYSHLLPDHLERARGAVDIGPRGG